MRNAHQPFRSERLSIPGKVFVLGEYAVLEGMPALVAAVGPRFAAWTVSPGEKPAALSPGCPAARLLAARAPGLALGFRDPHEGRGGFGASTAQFIAAWKLGGGANDLGVALAAYRSLEPRSSGADLVAQWRGGVTLYEPGSGASDVSISFDWNLFLVFSATAIAGRKVATHEHLAALARPPHGLGVSLGDGLEAVRRGDAMALGRALGAYADVLAHAGLEVPGAGEDRMALSRLDGVVGAKGAGAGLSDTVLVLMRPGATLAAREAVIEAARARGLRLVSDGLMPETGAS